MNSIIFCALLLVLVTVHASRFETPSLSNLQLLKELELELAMEDIPMSRPRRVPGSPVKTCGKVVLKYVQSVCDGGCTADTGIDLSSRCCASPCDDTFIRTACCP